MSTESNFKSGCIQFVAVGLLLMLIRYCADVGDARADTESMVMDVLYWFWLVIKWVVAPIIVLAIIYGLFTFLGDDKKEEDIEDEDEDDDDF